MGILAVHVAVNTGRLPLTREKTGRIPGRIVTPLSGLGNDGYLYLSLLVILQFILFLYRPAS